MSYAIAVNKEIPLSDRERWTKLAAYIAQTANTIIQSYDKIKIEETLTELEQYVEENILSD